MESGKLKVESAKAELSGVRDSGFGIRDSGKELRKFGLSVGIVFVLLATLALYRHKLPMGTIMLGGGSLLITAGLLRPLLLKRVHWAWMKMAGILGFVNTRIILGAIFFVLFTPVGLVLRLLRIDLLGRKLNPDVKSYWIDVRKQPATSEAYLNPF